MASRSQRRPVVRPVSFALLAREQNRRGNKKVYREGPYVRQYGFPSRLPRYIRLSELHIRLEKLPILRTPPVVLGQPLKTLRSRQQFSLHEGS
jgi:hypothetical protein